MSYCRKIFEEVLDVHDEECLKEVEAAAEYRSIKKKELVIRQGEVQTEIPFIISGSFIGYSVDSAGRHSTDCIVTFFGAPATPAGELEAFLRPSDFSMEALEDSEVVIIPTETIVRIISVYPEVALAMQRIVAFSLTHHRTLQRMMNLPIKDRYLFFKETFPELSRRLNKSTVAMCLNVPLPSLSRAINELEN